jgi:hypothetical protein
MKKAFFKRYWWLLLIIGLVVVAAGFGVKGIVHNHQLSEQKDHDFKGLSENQTPDIFQNVFSESHYYTDDSNAVFTFPPVALEDITLIEPLGYSASGEGKAESGAGTHQVPSDHMYIRVETIKGQAKVFNVYAVADCYLANICYFPGFWAGSDGTLHQLDEITLQFQVSINLFLWETGLTALTPELKAKIGELQEGTQNFRAIPVKAGELMGQAGGSQVLQAIDFWAIDLSVNAQFIHPEWYGVLSGHSTNPLAYYIEPLRSQLYAKLPPRTEPRAGQFAYDIDGKLVGNWFVLKDTFKYPDVLPDQMPQLAFVYSNRDPSLIYIGYNVEGMTWVVKGNSPDPANVDVKSGTIKYELMDERNYDKLKQIFKTECTMLVQMLENRHIKIELFEGMTAEEVTGFDDNAIEFFR